MVEKTKVIGNGKIDVEGLKKIGKSFLITLAGAAIAFILQLTDVVDFGGYQNIAVVIFPWLANTLKVWLGKYEFTA